MEDLLTYSVLKGMIIPAQAIMYILSGHFATNILNIQKTVLLFNGNKAAVVAVASLPFAIVYVATGTHWENVLATFFAANTAYAYGIKNVINLITKTKKPNQ
jgi:hypothetical protein